MTLISTLLLVRSSNFSEAGFPPVAQAGLELVVILLASASQGWDYSFKATQSTWKVLEMFASHLVLRFAVCNFYVHASFYFQNLSGTAFCYCR